MNQGIYARTDCVCISSGNDWSSREPAAAAFGCGLFLSSEKLAQFFNLGTMHFDQDCGSKQNPTCSASGLSHTDPGTFFLVFGSCARLVTMCGFYALAPCAMIQSLHLRFQPKMHCGGDC